MAELLIDTVPLTLQLHESSNDPNKIIVRGEFARSDRPTENKRLYRESLWRREFGRLKESISNRKVFGELDHPSDGRTKLQRVSHIITSLNIEGNQVVGEAEVLDTPNGRIMKAIAAAGGQVGVSSRGFGSVKNKADGVMEVLEDFRLDTFDFVADPATKTAYPKVFKEEAEHIVDLEGDVELTLESLKQHYPGLISELQEQFAGDTGGLAEAIVRAEKRTEARMQESFSQNVRKAMEAMRTEIEEQVRSDMASDPEVAGARQIVERIAGLVTSFGMDPAARERIEGLEKEIKAGEAKLADKELEIQRLQRENEHITKLAVKAGMKLHVEQELGADPSKEAILALIGDLGAFKTTEEVDERIKTVRDELTRRVGPTKVEADESSKLKNLEAKLAEATRRAEEAEQLFEEMKSKADKAAEVAEDVELNSAIVEAIEAYSGDDAEGFKNALAEAKTALEVASISARFKPRKKTLNESDIDKIRARVGRGKQRSLEEDTNGPTKTQLSEHGPLGDLLGEAEFAKLSGTGKPA